MATASGLNQPYGTAADNLGNVYIADSHNNRIRKVNTSGNISTIAGTGTGGLTGNGTAATGAEINTPYDVAVDSSGNVYFSDTSNNEVREINTSSGIITNFAGSPTGVAGSTGNGGQATSALLNKPSGLAFDPAGNLTYRTNNVLIQKFQVNSVNELTSNWRCSAPLPPGI